jgi:hypothetical protein
MGYLFDKMAANKNLELEKTQEEIRPLKSKSTQFRSAYNKQQAAEKELGQMTEWMQDRYYWSDVLSELRQVLIRAETSTRAKVRKDAGVWIEQLVTTAPRTAADAMFGGPAASPAAAATPGMSPEMMGMSAAEREMFRRRYGVGEPAAPPPVSETPAVDPNADPNAAAAGTTTEVLGPESNTNEVHSISLTFRAISLQSASAAANTELAFTVLNELRASPLFDDKKTQFSGNISADEPPGTFTFGVNVKLKRPLKLQ